MNKTTTTSPWIKIFQPSSHPKLRLFCFHSSASGASLFRLWGKHLPSNIEVCAIQLPGRETRIKETLITKWDDLLSSLTKDLQPFLTEYPFVFFGHSLGGLICFEVARKLRAKKLPTPKYMFISGRRAPHIPIDNQLHQASNQTLISTLREYGGTPEAVLENQDLMELFLPILRADFTLNEKYIYSLEAPFEFPIVAFRGINDTAVNLQQLSEWEKHTVGNFALHEFPGGHMFFLQQPETLIEAILKFM
ncbi:thioesterase II family protein [Okeania sp. SIO2B3]|uniref:thioesterase II family protein n=1 Tax=Okeania sp. SIO2B3 TaxID=2607784 RepID=UPI0013BECD17|nr:alpha/beta fold hydrolase [Okeania sp. SIO2B3]NET45469.1 thioesterase [Okeania sp. SIO2B3]